MNDAIDSRNNDQHDDKKSPDRLEREVDQARARLSRTASELSHRLTPGELIDQALGMAREHGGEFGHNLGTQIKNNPLPMILTSIGLSWMMMSSGKRAAAHTSGRHAKDNYGNSPESHGSSFKDALDDTRDKATAIDDRVHDAGENMKESTLHFRENLIQFYQDQPLIAGSVGIAIGAALGALVPPSGMEDDLFGKVSDRSVASAKEKAQNKYDQIRESAR